jgi:hypothetical protein
MTAKKKKNKLTGTASVASQALSSAYTSTN